MKIGKHTLRELVKLTSCFKQHSCQLKESNSDPQPQYRRYPPIPPSVARISSFQIYHIIFFTLTDSREGIVSSSLASQNGSQSKT